MARVTDSQILEDYFKHCKRQDKTQKTIENYMSAIKIFRDFLKKRKMDFLSGDGELPGSLCPGSGGGG